MIIAARSLKRIDSLFVDDQRGEITIGSFRDEKWGQLLLISNCTFRGEAAKAAIVAYRLLIEADPNNYTPAAANATALAVLQAADAMGFYSPASK